MQAPFAPESTTRPIPALSPRRLVTQRAKYSTKALAAGRSDEVGGIGAFGALKLRPTTEAIAIT